MTDEQIIFHWLRSTRDFNACRCLAHLSQRRISDIISLICRAGYMTKWSQNKHIIKVKGNKHGEHNKANARLSNT